MKKTKLTRSLMAAVSIVALSAVMYGCVHSGDDAVEIVDGPDLGTTRGAAAAAATAAMAASDAAAAAVVGVDEIRNLDAVAFLRAENAAAAAKAASDDAAKASAAAVAATTLEDAEAAQEAAEAAQAAAEAARDNAVTYASVVQDIKDANDEAARLAAEAEAARIAAEEEAARIAAEEAAAAAAAELDALNDARGAADMAADDAATDSYAAMAALAGVEGMESYDQASYDAAAAAAQAASDAAAEARDASDAANRATTSGDAEMHQMTAETQRGMAADALADATMYAGMVTEAKRVADEEAERQRLAELAAELLADTKQEAADAARDAMTASTDASAAVEAQRANKDLSTVAAAAFARAEDAAADAATASGDAAVASNAAQAAMTQEDAAMYRDQAVAARRAAELAEANAMSFAGMVEAVKTAIDNAATEMDRLGEAKMKAGEAFREAEQHAIAADTAATAAEAAAPGSSAATNARAAAHRAELAAGLAEAANMAAQAATDSATAITQQMEAETQRNQARFWLTLAVGERDDAVDARNAALQVQEERDLANAKQAAEELWDDADDGIMLHYNAVMEKAGLTSGQATAARASANKAMAARTDYANADKYADMAESSDREAQASLGRAMTAKGEADTARQAAMDATTSDAAEMALDALRAANAKLTAEHTGEMGAGMDYMAAEAAAMKAAHYAEVHVLGLLIHANAQDLNLGDPADVDLAEALARAKDARLDAVSGAINNAAGTAGTDADNDSSTTDGSGGTTATATWPAFSSTDTQTDPATEDDEAVVGTLSIDVNPNGGGVTTALLFRTMAEEEDDSTTTEVDETIVTATALDPGLGNFMGYSISDRGNHAIVFTDKMQGTPAVAEVSFIAGEELLDDSVQGNAITDLGTWTGTGYTGVTYYVGAFTEGTTDTDTAFMGSLNCPSPPPADGCSASTGADGTITVTGFRFTGSRAARAAVEAAPAAENMDYLAFGVWLLEDGDATSDTADPPAFAAFADGGEPIASFADYATLTGEAHYSGSAAGVYTQGDSVDYFQASARLTANFGAPGIEGNAEADDDEIGTVSGTISSIMAGGVATGDVINLRSADIVNANTAFAGDARMGDGVDTDDDDVLEYTYNGTWSGNFYGANADDDTTADVNEQAAPDAVAGTFGVTGTEGEGDAAVTTTYVGAFGARR